MCGSQSPVENEDIPGRLFGVTAQTGGFVVPSCRRCNRDWAGDQEFVRLRVTLHAGSTPGAGYINERELARVSGVGQKMPHIDRYMRERKKQYVEGGREFLGLTDVDLERFRNVVRHWAAGIHYRERNIRAALPGSVHERVTQPALFRRLQLQPSPHGKWNSNEGSKFGSWWFLPGPEPMDSVAIINLLDSDELWFLVRFP